MYRDYSGTCDEYGGWATKGWWTLSPGQVKHVVNTKNRYVYWYAKSANGREWTGDDHHMYVDPKAPFESCRDIGVSSWDYVGLRTTHVGSNVGTHTVNLR